MTVWDINKATVHVMSHARTQGLLINHGLCRIVQIFINELPTAANRNKERTRP